MAARKSIFCKIKSYSHTLTEEDFGMFRKPGCHINVYDISKDTFFAGVHSEHSPPGVTAPFEEAGTYLLSCFLMALNVGTFGHFDWDAKTGAPCTYSLLEKDTGTAVGLMSANHYQYPDTKAKMTTQEIARTVMVFGGLAEERVDYVRTEYLKGVYHLGLEFFDLTFRKDAFANFYRAFEHFSTDRILKVARLHNELNQMQAAMRQVRMSDDMIETFTKQLYRIRCNQVMHSQREQVEISWEDVAKMKIFADVLIFSHYEAEWKRLGGWNRKE